MPKLWQIPQAPPASPLTPTQFFSDIVFCPFFSECHTCWKTPLKHYPVNYDVEYSEYRLHWNVVLRVKQHFREHHNHIRGKTQINITVNSTANKFALSTGKIGQCPTCREQLVRPTEEEKIDPSVCTSMAKSINNHRWANRACRDRFISLHTDEDLENVVPKTFIWGYRSWIPIVDDTERHIERQAEEIQGLGINCSGLDIADSDSRENTPLANPSNISDDDEVMGDSPPPVPVDLIVPKARRQRSEGTTKHSKGARGHKTTPEPVSVSTSPCEATPYTSTSESSSGTENTDDTESTPPSSVEDITIPPLLGVHHAHPHRYVNKLGPHEQQNAPSRSMPSPTRYSRRNPFTPCRVLRFQLAPVQMSCGPYPENYIHGHSPTYLGG